MKKHPVKREVVIEFNRDTWFVRYAERKPGQRYLAAQFFARDWTREQVAQWVKDSPKIVEKTA